jgi:hypothetical protein
LVIKYLGRIAIVSRRPVVIVARRRAGTLYAVFMLPCAIPHRFLTRRGLAASEPDFQEVSMSDLVMLLVAAALFAATIGYAYACDRI